MHLDLEKINQIQRSIYMLYVTILNLNERIYFIGLIFVFVSCVFVKTATAKHIWSLKTQNDIPS